MNQSHVPRTPGTPRNGEIAAAKIFWPIVRCALGQGDEPRTTARPRRTPSWSGGITSNAPKEMKSHRALRERVAWRRSHGRSHITKNGANARSATADSLE